MKRNVVYFVMLALFAGCGSMPDIPPGETIKYKGRGKQPAPETPPGFTSPPRDERNAAPDVIAPGSATLSTYNAERGGRSRAGATDLLPNVAKVRIEKVGSQRWLVVPYPPEKVWPMVKEFWQGMGFLVIAERPDVGTMETDWAENRVKITDDPIRNFLSEVFDAVHSAGERDKFRTRLERGTEPNTTEIYISHRGMVEVYQPGPRESTAWQPRPPDPELEAEFLHRLMVRFGVEDARTRAQLAGNEIKVERVRLVRSAGGGSSDKLELTEPFDRAWRRVGMALDYIGFSVEDRDRSKGYYLVRYADPQIDGQRDRGLLSALNSRKSDKSTVATEQYRVMVVEANSVSNVQVQNKDGQQENSATGRRILSLLYDQLK
jgi:outer membrane protein assembly factor BamC